MLTILLVSLTYNHYFILDKKKILMQLVDEEEELVDINIDRKDNIAIGYNYIPLRNLLEIVTVILKIMRWNYERELNFRREKKRLN